MPLVLIHPDIDKRREEAKKIISQNGFSNSHPDLLWVGEEEKLGIEQARQIKDFLTLKPYQGSSHAVVLLSADNLTPDAQNTLLKTLEEPLGEITFLLGLSSAEHLLPTVLSRCQVIDLTDSKITTALTEKQIGEIERLISSSPEQRFQYIEKLKDREKFLILLTSYFRHQLLQNSAGAKQVPPQGWNYLSRLIQAERWAKQNVNIRAILEYLMLHLPR